MGSLEEDVNKIWTEESIIPSVNFVPFKGVTRNFSDLKTNQSLNLMNNNETLSSSGSKQNCLKNIHPSIMDANRRASNQKYEGNSKQFQLLKFLEKYLSQLAVGETWLSIFLGQVLSVILCVTAICSVYLVDGYNIRIPCAQNFFGYFILACIFTTILVFRKGDTNFIPVLKTRGWKYALVAAADVEANFLVVKAYQFTTLTSVQLLDCFTIPTVLALSWLILRIRYKVVHIIGVSVALLGVCCLVWADIEEGRSIGPGKDRFLGDMLCLCGAFLYGVSNVAQEFVVKTFDVVEYLGMIGLFGSLLIAVQAGILESNNILESDWMKSSESIMMPPVILLLLYTLSLTVYYMISGYMIKLSGATAFNMSILTADFYSLLVGIFLFHYKFHALYFLSFVLVMTGVIFFSIKPTVIASNVYRTTLLRDHTTTLDLEMMASTPVGNNAYVPPSQQLNNNSSIDSAVLTQQGNNEATPTHLSQNSVDNNVIRKYGLAPYESSISNSRKMNSGSGLKTTTTGNAPSSSEITCKEQNSVKSSSIQNKNIDRL